MNDSENPFGRNVLNPEKSFYNDPVGWKLTSFCGNLYQFISDQEGDRFFSDIKMTGEFGKEVTQKTRGDCVNIPSNLFLEYHVQLKRVMKEVAIEGDITIGDVVQFFPDGGLNPENWSLLSTEEPKKFSRITTAKFAFVRSQNDYRYAIELREFKVLQSREIARLSCVRNNTKHMTHPDFTFEEKVNSVQRESSIYLNHDTLERKIYMQTICDALSDLSDVLEHDGFIKVQSLQVAQKN